jgi:hypothetical protein
MSKSKQAALEVALRTFCAGDRVRISGDFFWAKGATGTVSVPPDAVTALSGAWDGGLSRQEVSACVRKKISVEDHTLRSMSETGMLGQQFCSLGFVV